MSIFSIKNLSDTKKIIQNLNLEINLGEVCYFLCEKGVGEVLFEILCGYKPPGCGKIFLGNINWLKLNDEMRCILNRHKVGIASTKYPLIDEMTIEENIIISGLLDGMVSDPLVIAQMFHIEHLMKRNPSDITYTEQLRCIVARALYNNKDIVVIDDIYYRLKEKTDFSLMLYNAAKKLNTAVICISEELDDSYFIYDILHKYLPEEKRFFILDYRI